MTSIVILTYNNLEYTAKCIESINMFTDKGTYEIIVVDNNSSDGTADWLSKQQGIKIILNEQNLGFPKGCNQGIEAASGDKILLLNNDTIVTPGWLNNMIRCLQSSEDIGAVGPVTNSAAYYQSMNVDYTDFEGLVRFSGAINISNESMWEERQKLIGFCLLIKRSVLNEVGLLDEDFTPGNFEDDDLCCRIYKSGYRLMLCKDSYIHHYGGTSFKKLGDLNSLISENERKFKEKWGFTSRENMDIHRELVDYIKKDANESFRLMEIGCGTGANLHFIKSRFRNAQLFGIDNNEKALQFAGDRFEVICGDIEKMELQFSQKYFDYILLGDVLQQFDNPEKVLRKIRNYIKTSGKLLISVPNIANYYFIYNLLKGNSLYNNSATDYFINNRYKRVFNFNDMFFMLEQSGYGNIDGTKVYGDIDNADREFVEKLSSIVEVSDKDQFTTKKYALSVDVVNQNKICFITCVNDQVYYNEALKYIESLEVPDGFKVENICITEAESMAKAYNEAMNSSNAKYKIYMHQDVFIINKNFLNDVIDTFRSNEKLGMLGVIGARSIGNNGMWWESHDKYGKVYENHDGFMKLMKFDEVYGSYERAEAIDGLIMVTSQDFVWREDIFDGWHFYDVSQCFEFRNQGYEVGVINQEQPSCIHDCGLSEIDEEYHRYKQIFIKEYLSHE